MLHRRYSPWHSPSRSPRAKELTERLDLPVQREAQEPRAQPGHKVRKDRLVPPGPVGPAGALNRADLTGTIGSSGAVTALLPPSAVAGGRVPVIACYIGSTTQTWLAVAQIPATSTGAFCGLTGIGTASPGITLINVTAGWNYYIIAVW